MLVPECSISRERQCSLSNNVGGGDHAETTRYELRLRDEKQHTDWTYELLADAVRTVTAWLDGRLPRAVVLDVVVPTHRHRLDLSYLQRILALKGDERIVTKFFARASRERMRWRDPFPSGQNRRTNIEKRLEKRRVLACSVAHAGGEERCPRNRRQLQTR
jgi:hypothetical protein